LSFFERPPIQGRALKALSEGNMTKSRLPALEGLDTLLQEQALEMANLRAARDDRRAMEGQRTPKSYRLGPENPNDGTWTIEVADRGADNWRQRETCHTLQLAQERVQQLTADDTEFFRGVSTPDRDR
jgi:hypothetical protein